MRLKTFSGKTMAEAMELVRRTLGADAIIVSTQETREAGVQITAAIEEALIEKAISQALAETEAPVAQPEGNPVADALAFHGVPPRLAQRLVKIASAANARDTALSLAGALDLSIKFQPLAAAPEAPLMLIGPPGMGKTLAAAKIAAAATLAGRDVEVISTDTVRNGGLEQLAGFLRLLKRDVVPAADPAALAAALARVAPGRLAIVDSRAVNPYDDGELIELKRFVATAKIEPVLVLAGGLDPGEAADQAAAFGTVKPRRLIATRLDGARRFGAVLAAADAGGLAIAALGATPFVGEGLAAVNPLALARLILRDPGESAIAAYIRKAVS
jgi:flagellar biosynthesis protein FlhF